MKFEIRGDSKVINHYHYWSCGAASPKRISCHFPNLSALAPKRQNSAKLYLASCDIILIMTLVLVIRLIIDWYIILHA
jgi:hypothetical protein